MKFLKIAIGLAIATALSGCGSTGSLNLLGAGSVSATASPNTDASVKSIAEFTVSDLQGADADAVAHNDLIAHACYPALEQFVSSQQAATGSLTTPLTVTGAFSVFQRGRDTVKLVHSTLSGGIPQYLVIGCAPLVQDVINDQATFLATIAQIGLHP